MNQTFKTFLWLTLMSNSFMCANVIPFISIRSQSENAARELVLWQTQINQACIDKVYGALSVTPEYTRTFNDLKITRCLFGDALDHKSCPPIIIQGSEIPNRNINALLADYFGLPTDFSSIVQLEPCIDNFLVDVNFYLGLDEWVPGLYFRIHAPLVHTRWNLNFHECSINEGEKPYNTGYFNGTIETDLVGSYGVNRSNLLDSFTSFICDRQTPKIDGATFQSLEYARMATHVLDDTKLSEIQAALGWNFCRDVFYHVGINVRGAAPVGTRPRGIWLFEPIVGNGAHWELGAGLSAHWQFWSNNIEDSNLSLYADGYFTHLFKTRQQRTFDLCGKPLSRYMLAARMKQPTLNVQNSDGDVPPYQFADEFAPVANLSTIDVDVSAFIQCDIVLKLAYTYRNTQIDFGYEFWGRSCETITPRNICNIAAQEIWTLKGDAYVYGFTALNNAIPLSASQADATLFCGTNNALRTDIRWTLNPGVDNAQCAFDNNGTPINNNLGYGIIGEGQMYSSFNPSVFNPSETKFYDIKGAQTRGISHKLFCNIGYLWCDCNDWTPFLGIGGEAEFGIIDKKCSCNTLQQCVIKTPAAFCARTRNCTNCCDFKTTGSMACCNRECNDEKYCCTDCAISQWGVWIKGGFSFN